MNFKDTLKEGVYQEAFYKNNVKAIIPGMEIDIKRVDSVYETLLEAGKIESELNVEDAKCQTIKTMLPFVGTHVQG